MVIRLAGSTLTCPANEVSHTGDRSPVDGTLRSRWFRVEQLASWALGSAARLVVVSGDEPLRQQSQLVPLVRCLARAGRWVEIETSGSWVPDAALAAMTDMFVVSPRAPGSGAGPSSARPINPAALATFADSDRAVFTFAVSSPSELAEIAELEQRFALYPIWVVPAGTTAAAVLAVLSWLAHDALARGWHLSCSLPALLDQPGQ